MKTSGFLRCIYIAGKGNIQDVSVFKATWTKCHSEEAKRLINAAQGDFYGRKQV